MNRVCRDYRFCTRHVNGRRDRSFVVPREREILWRVMQNRTWILRSVSCRITVLRPSIDFTIYASCITNSSMAKMWRW